MHSSVQHPRRSLWIVLTLIAIIALAAGLRFYQLDRLPPGLSYDEALNDLLALRIRSLLPPPVFIADEFGEEPAHMILIALLYRVAGHPFAEAGRVASAIGGMVAVLFVFLAAREMFRPSAGEAQASLIGLISAGVLATLYWHVHYSRLGMEPPMTPTFSAPAFYLFWLALNRRRWYWFALAGGALALCLYTYQAAYLLPLVIILYFLWRWGTQSNAFKAEWRNALVYAAGALLVYAPHLVFFIQNPQWLMTRPSQAGSKSGALQVILNAGRMVGGLFWRGDTNLRLNLPGRPALDWVQSLAFLIGLVKGLSKSLRPGTVFTLLWLIVALLPSVLSDLAPHFGRSVGATPPLAILVAVGITQISNIKYKIPKASVPIGVVAAVAALGYSTVTMARDYFVIWARDPGLFTAFDVGLRQSAEYLALLPDDELISLSPTDRDLPMFRFTFGDDVKRLKTFNGRRCAVYPAAPERDWTHVAVVGQDVYSAPVIQRVFPSAQIAREFRVAGATWAVAYRVLAGSRARTPQNEMAIFGERIALVQETLAGETSKVWRAGETLPVTLTWKSLAATGADYTLFVHLSPALDSPPIAQEDAQPCDNSYPSSWWTPGEMIQEDRRIVIPANAAPGVYVLTTGIYELATGQRLPVRAIAESPAPPDRFVLGTITLTR